MDIEDYLKIAHEKPALPFLVIGGYAVAAHGHSRTTLDVDFLVSSNDRDAWRQRILHHGFELVSDLILSPLRR